MRKVKAQENTELTLVEQLKKSIQSLEQKHSSTAKREAEYVAGYWLWSNNVDIAQNVKREAIAEMLPTAELLYAQAIQFRDAFKKDLDKERGFMNDVYRLRDKLETAKVQLTDNIQLQSSRKQVQLFHELMEQHSLEGTALETSFQQAMLPASHTSLVLGDIEREAQSLLYTSQAFLEMSDAKL